MFKKHFSPLYCQCIADSIVGSIIGAGGDILSGVVNGVFNSVEAKKNRDFQRDERLATQQYNLDMWNKANEYNSLSSQLERAREAGVSPSAVLDGSAGKQQASPVTSSPMSGSQASGSPMPTGIFTGIAKQVAEINKLKAETKGQELQNEFDTATMEVRKQIENYNFEHLKNVVKQDVLDFGIKDVNLKSARLALEWQDKFNQIEFDTACQRLTELRTRIDGMIKDNRNKDKQGELLDKQIEGSDIANQGKLIENYGKKLDNGIKQRSAEAIIRKALAEAKIADADAVLRTIEAEFADSTGIPSSADEFDIALALWWENRFVDYSRDMRTPMVGKDAEKFKHIKATGYKNLPKDFNDFIDRYGMIKRGPLQQGYYNFYDPRTGIYNPVYLGSPEKALLDFGLGVIPG